jgi:hypothetical protein
MGGDLKKVSEMLAELVKELELSLRDAEKFDNGNASAGVRVRKKAQEAIAKLKDVRKLVSEVKEARKGE